MNRPFTITTPIYYVNDEPHIGHAYTTILADVLARYARLQGKDVFFVTGTDEHGQKVQLSAEARGLSPQQHADQMVHRFDRAWKKLAIGYDTFIRTTEKRHIRVVQEVLDRLWRSGAIYEGNYVGWYCVPDERFWTEKELLDGKCPDCNRPVEKLVEPNYFFRMSQYQTWLVSYIASHPQFIQPHFRRNEVLGFLRQPLGDLCISRPKKRLNWGVTLPFDDAFVTYVWFDALFNYATAAGYLQDEDRFAHLWPETIHLIGKDILTTHAVYWPTMLHAAGISQPKTIFAHGWWIVNGAKISKSTGNAIRPLDLIELYGVDAYRYFLMSEMTLGQDTIFDTERLHIRYTSELANDLGNLLSRILTMIEKYCESLIPDYKNSAAIDLELNNQCEPLPGRVFEMLNAFELNEALFEIRTTVRAINGYLERAAPWKLSRPNDQERVNAILYHAAEALRICTVLLQPVMPVKMPEFWRQLGWIPGSELSSELTWGKLVPGTKTQKGDILFPKFDRIV